MNYNDEQRYQWRTGQSRSPRAPKFKTSLLGILVAAVATILVMSLHGCGGAEASERKNRDVAKKVLDAMHHDASGEMLRYGEQQMRRPVIRKQRDQ